jgi:hypothetical protein
VPISARRRREEEAFGLIGAGVLIDKVDAVVGAVRLGPGVQEREPSIRNKLARGKFTAVFFLQCLVAIGATTLRLEDA